MPKFFTTNIRDNNAIIEGDDARHIAKSLRMNVGDEVCVSDFSGTDFACKIAEISHDIVVAEIISRRASASEARVKTSLYQALPKSDKLEYIAQKAVELGVFEITPVLTSRCIARWDSKDETKKRERLQKIMAEAAKQSGRSIIPKIQPLLTFEQALNQMQTADLALMFYEKSTSPLRDLIDADAKSIAIMVGSEGGFSEAEATFAKDSGVLLAGLGSRILRCETAPVCALSAINYAMGEF